MKWKSQLIGFLTLVIQMTAIFITWQSKWLASENAPLYMAMFIILIGATGGALIWLQSKKNNIENKSLETTILLIGSLIATAGGYLVFFPVVAIFMHSSITSILFILGILAPSLAPKFLSINGGANKV